MKILTFLFFGFNPVEFVLRSFFLYLNLKQKRIHDSRVKGSSSCCDKITKNEQLFASQGRNKLKADRLFNFEYSLRSFLCQFYYEWRGRTIE